MKYFVVTGTGRCGTLWLYNALSSIPNIDVKHDLFFPRNMNTDFEHFRTTNSPLVGTISGPARYVIPEIDEEFDPLWAMLWRNPLEVVRSHVDMGLQGRQEKEDDNSIEHLIYRTAHILFGDMEVTLNILKSRYIKNKNFYLEELTKSTGLVQVMDWLQHTYDLPAEGQPIANDMPLQDRRTNTPDNWSKKLRFKVINSILSTPLVRAAVECYF